MQKLKKTRQQTKQQETQQKTFDNNNTQKRKYRKSSSPPLDREKISFRFWLDELYIYLFFSKFFVFILFLFCCYFVVLLLFLVFALSFWAFACISETTLVQTNNNKKPSRQKHTAHPAGTWEIFIRGRVVGWRMSCFFVMLSRSLSKLLHLQSNKHI